MNIWETGDIVAIEKEDLSHPKITKLEEDMKYVLKQKKHRVVSNNNWTFENSFLPTRDFTNSIDIQILAF